MRSFANEGQRSDLLKELDVNRDKGIYANSLMLADLGSSMWRKLIQHHRKKRECIIHTYFSMHFINEMVFMQ